MDSNTNNLLPKRLHLHMERQAQPNQLQRPRLVQQPLLLNQPHRVIIKPLRPQQLEQRLPQPHNRVTTNITMLTQDTIITQHKRPLLRQLGPPAQPPRHQLPERQLHKQPIPVLLRTTLVIHRQVSQEQGTNFKMHCGSKSKREQNSKEKLRYSGYCPEETLELISKCSRHS